MINLSFDGVLKTLSSDGGGGLDLGSSFLESWIWVQVFWRVESGSKFSWELDPGPSFSGELDLDPIFLLSWIRVQVF